MKKLYYLPFLILLLTGITSCELLERKLDFDRLEDNLTVTSSKWSNDHKYLTLRLNLTGEVYNDSLYDGEDVKFDIKETWETGDTMPERFTPKLKSIKSLNTERFNRAGLGVLLLVDLTLPQTSVNYEQKIARMFNDLFSESDIYISFMKGDGTATPSTPVTKDLLDNYFVSDNAVNKHLYSNMLEKLKELDNPLSPVDSLRRRSLVVLSDGAVWDDANPLDPQHFDVQNELIQYINDLQIKRPLIYIHVPSIDDQGFVNDEPNMMLQDLCSYHRGIYQEQFHWSTLLDSLSLRFDDSVDDIELTLEYPDETLFDGDLHTLILRGRSHGVANYQSTYEVWLGDLFNPIIVNGRPYTVIVLQGLLIGILLLILTYLILQVVEPFIRYKWFERKYVAYYTGPNMSINGQKVGNTCYLCKAPFQPGDRIVGKCQHTMHEECWNENEYHCPEFGVHCQEGSHYYNPANKLDKHNALFYRDWVLLAMVAALACWGLVPLLPNRLGYELVDRIYCLANDLEYGSEQAMSALASQMLDYTHLPAFSLYLGIILTFTLAFKTVQHFNQKRRLIEILVRSLIGGLSGYLVFMLSGVAIAVTDRGEVAYILEWIPWLVLTVLLSLTLTVRTRVKLQKKMLLMCVATSVAIMVVWYMIIIYNESDHRLSILFCYIVYSVCLAIGLAAMAPRSDHYFLHVEGPVKQMDIALYKWFRNAPHAEVTLGKSVDCSLQLSWDFNSTIAPFQAQLVQEHGCVYLVALEEGVLDDNQCPIPDGKKIKLHHNRSFTIGRTKFTYIEKDVIHK